MYACYIFKNKTKPLYIQWNIFNSSFLGITFCELNRQVSCLCMLNWQISTILRLYLQFGWYRIPFHSMFDLSMFHCINIVYNTNGIRFPQFVNFALCTMYILLHNTKLFFRLSTLDFPLNCLSFKVRLQISPLVSSNLVLCTIYY